MKIRQAVLSDFDQIVEIFTNHFEHDSRFAPIFNTSYPSTDDGKEFIAKFLVRSDYFLYVLEDKRVIVGYIAGVIKKNSARKSVKYAEIEGIYLKNNIRESGWGTKLMLKLKEQLKGKQITRLKVVTNENNSVARNFYEKNKFKEFATWYEMDLE